ncbi:hypothetical protein BGZ97_007835 [Linnemannia gamsii]|uniref:Gamma-soluble NSF attachment protein n=1 Tax=Linnemannia gamsii TaxID=64522 RepID=A0A9P6RA98_9FUNG|nr:hypothetical protein BGZ97_007835 [Linnemannia gamsii]
MGASEEARLKDAIDYMKEADKNTEKSWFKKPDWDIAAQYYEKAGQAFKAGKSYDQAVQAFIKASDAMIHATSYFMAGRALENGGNIALQNLGQPERAADMYKRASELFMQNMTPDRAAEMLEKSAKAMEPISVDQAIELYIGACNIYEGEDRARYATDTFKRTIALLVKHRRFDKATEILQRLGNVQKDTPNKMAYYKTLLSIIIVQLAAGDEVEAGKRFQAYCSVEGFVKSEESAVAHQMLDAFEHRDQGYYNHAAGLQHVGFLDNEIARLARSIVISDDLVSGGGYVEPNQPPQQQQFYQQGPNQPPRPSGQVQQQQQPPFQPQQQQYDRKDVYQPRPSQQPFQPQHQQQSSGGYDISPPAPGPPAYSDERSESDWRALTEKPASSTNSPAPHQPYQHQQHHQQPHLQPSQAHPGQAPSPSRQQQQPQPGAPPNRNYYQDDDDDGLL